MSNSTFADMYKWLLFDADNTLMDFDQAARTALQVCMKSHGLLLTDDNYKIYKHVNHDCWAAFERGELDPDRLRWLRFEKFFEWINVRGLDPKSFGAAYLSQLSIANAPYDGVQVMLHALKEKYKISIITNGLKEVQRPNYQKRGWESLFDSIVVSDEIGVQKPFKPFFDYTWSSIDHDFNKEEVLVIGDNLHSDIIGGLDYGLRTCWISRGRTNNTDIQPAYTVDHVLDLASILT